jgi:hypothetical protein
MYQLIPLLLAVALLMPWLGPADPGNRIAAANAADGLAEQALIYHQAAIRYVLANPSASGVIHPTDLPSGWSIEGIVSCAHAHIVATYVTIPTDLPSPAIAAAMSRLWGRYPIVGQTASSTLINPFTGLAVPLPCPVPEQTPAILSQVGG